VNGIVTLAMNLSIDKTSSVEIVSAERKPYCKPPRFEPGGGGVIVYRAIKKRGGESMLLYAAGDLTGRRFMDLLDLEGISHRRINIAGMTRESLVLLEESTGRQFRFGMPGPSLCDEEWKRCLDEVTALCIKNDFLVASGSLQGPLILIEYAL
jgi:6-phosphofructokinase 2